MPNPDLAFPIIVGLVALPAGGLLLARPLARRRPAHAHTVLVTTMFATLLAPLAVFAAAAVGWSWRAAPIIEARANVAAPSGLVADLTAAAGRGSVLPWLAATAGLVSILLLSRLAVALLGAARTARHAAAVDPALLSSVSVVRLHRAGVRAVGTDDVPCPAVFGWAAPPVLFLTRRALDLPEARLDAVILHELHHLRRRDHWWRLVADVGAALLPWHPLVHALRRAIARTSEAACDAAVLDHGVSPAGYADTLLELIAPRPTGLPAFASAPSSLGRRIEQVLDPRPVRRARHGFVWPAAVALVAGLATGLLATTTPPAPVPATLPPAEVLAVAPVVAFPSVLDLGTPPAGDAAADGVVYLFNAGRRSVRLEEVRASCGCTTAPNFEAQTLAPGAQIEVPIRMTTGPTDKVRGVTFLFDDQDPLEIEVYLAALPTD